MKCPQNRVKSTCGPHHAPLEVLQHWNGAMKKRSELLGVEPIGLIFRPAAIESEQRAI
jgi:hypothetical protein